MTIFKIGTFLRSTLVCAAGLTALASNSFAADADGCYDPAPNCVSSTSRWSGNKYLMKVTNHCNAGIYVRVCAKRTSGPSDCGASHIGANRSYTFSGFNVHSDGRYNYQWVGSQNFSKDWVCAGKVSNWNRDPFR